MGVMNLKNLSVRLVKSNKLSSDYTAIGKFYNA